MNTYEIIEKFKNDFESHTEKILTVDYNMYNSDLTFKCEGNSFSLSTYQRVILSVHMEAKYKNLKRREREFVKYIANKLILCN